MLVKLDIPLSGPDLEPSDIEAVVAVLRTPNLSRGPSGPRFERAFAEYTGAKHAVAVSSGTSALHLCILASGLGEGDEVITSPFSFIASTNCLLFEGVKPVFVDIEPETWNLDPGAVEAAITPKTRGILPIHVFGRPCRMAELNRIAGAHDLTLIEDSCESLGTRVGRRMTGTFGAAGVFAFYPNKQMTTGEGGMIVTDDDRLADLCRSLRNQGRGEGHGWLEHVRLGYNYRLSDLQSALGVSQLRRIEQFVEKRQRIFDLYRDALAPIDGLVLPAPALGDERISWFVYVVRLADEYSTEDRSAVLDRLQAAGIGCGNYFPPIHLQPHIRERFGYGEGAYPVTEHVSARTIALPFHNRLSEGDVRDVAGALASALAGLPRRTS
jgi:perosamine synthetase